MKQNPFKSEGNNVNAFDLVQSINYLIDTDQWNDVTKYSAATTPHEFMKMVENFRENGEIMHQSHEVDLWLHDIGQNKIYCIKTLRELFGLCLADAKYLSEKSPVKLLEATFNSDLLCFVIQKFYNSGCRIMLKSRDNSTKSGLCEYVTYTSNPSIDLNWTRDPTFKCPKLNVVY